MDERLLTIDEVAISLNVSPSTVRRWVRSAKLVGQKAGVQWRFDPTVVRKAFEQGLLSGASQSSMGTGHSTTYPGPPEWARPLLARWRQFLEHELERVQPDHAVVNDRWGAKIWALIAGNRYSWGNNLWHSTALDLMPPTEMRRIFSHRKILLFDELMQHGREMHQLRQRLESVGASVTSVVCVRSRSHAESGELLEYKAIVCEDLDDAEFADRATAISRLLLLTQPPLDVDHLVVHASLLDGLEEEQFLEKLAKWGKAFIVWDPNTEQDFLAVTLDRPQFFDTADINWLNGFSLYWEEGPCKIRFYVKLRQEDRICYCSFIPYPDIEGSRATWMQAAFPATRSRSPREDTLHSGPSSLKTGDIEAELRRRYLTICVDLALKLLDDFVLSGAASDVGIVLKNSADAVDLGQLRATFGPSRGEEIAKRTREILTRAERGGSLFPQVAKSPPPLAIRTESEACLDDHDQFTCREELLKAIPQKHTASDVKAEPNQPIKYGELFRTLRGHSECTVGRVLDEELDNRGTAKPDIWVGLSSSKSGETDRLGRGYFRGEFGPWFEWDSSIVTDHDIVIRRTLGFGPTVVEQFLKRLRQSQMSATYFAKVFANLEHDWRYAFDWLYWGWRPYKYGPVPVSPAPSGYGHFVDFVRFLVDRKCLDEHREQHGSQIWSSYTAPSDSPVPWRTLYSQTTEAMTRAHVAGLSRLYAAIQEQCRTRRPLQARSLDLSEFRDPLVVLAAARNERIAYICGRFEVDDWKQKGRETVFPLVRAIASAGSSSPRPFLKPFLQEFASPARLLFNKIEMYRNLPHLRQQIVNLCNQGDFEVGEILLETVDVEPKFDSDSRHPMQNLEWACRVMRAFSSMTRQVLTACQLDVDERAEAEKVDKSGRTIDALYYLEELLACCPELQQVGDELHKICAVASGAKPLTLTEEVADCLWNTFRLILNLFDRPGLIPDPQEQLDKEHRQRWDGLLVRIREVQVPDPYAIALMDIYNIRNVPLLAPILGVSYDSGLHKMMEWVANEARAVVQNHPGVRLCGLVNDNIILAGQDCDRVLTAVLDIIKNTTLRLSGIDNRLAGFGLLRAGITWHHEHGADQFSGAQPGLIAYALAEKHGRPVGEICITRAVYDRLSMGQQREFAESDDDSPQGQVFIRPWSPERDSI